MQLDCLCPVKTPGTIHFLHIKKQGYKNIMVFNVSELKYTLEQKVR